MIDMVKNMRLKITEIVAIIEIALLSRKLC